MTQRKAQGLPAETIIIFAIVLIVAFLVIFFFSGKFNFFSKNVGTCIPQGGVCLANTQDSTCPSDKPIKMTTSDCPSEKGKQPNASVGGLCCLAVG